MENYIDAEKLPQVLGYDPASPLLFNTGLFLILFVVFIGVYSLLRRFPTAKKIFVILFSLYFYYKSSAWCCFILLGVCVSDFLLGQWLGSARKSAVRKLIVWINVVINIGMLVYFKYFNLILDTISNFGTVKFDALDIILPAGISFFTFRSISYIVDIYRGTIKPCDNFLNYTFYLTFFPPLLAGPVVRAKDMLPQVEQNPVASRAMVGEGIFLIISGLIKKVVVADFISGNFVDRIFDNPSLYSGFENLMGMYGFMLQLYCDFSGYSDIAIGIALMLGYRFLDNFNAPFKAQSPTEFWHRWHISLSTWLRDYVYIPLGGNRRGTLRTYVNNFLTMLVGGLWHGAAWKFVIWGGMHGVGLIVHKALRPWLVKIPDTWPVKAASWTLTMAYVSFLFIFFRAASFEDAWLIIRNIFGNFDIAYLAPFVRVRYVWLIFVAMIIAVHSLPTRWINAAGDWFVRAPFGAKLAVFIIAVQLVVQFMSEDVMPFIYFQF